MLQSWVVKCRHLLLRDFEGKLGSVETLNGVFLASIAFIKLRDLQNVNLFRALFALKEQKLETPK